MSIIKYNLTCFVDYKLKMSYPDKATRRKAYATKINLAESDLQKIHTKYTMQDNNELH